MEKFKISMYSGRMETGTVVHILDEGLFLILNANQERTILNPDEGRYHQDAPEGAEQKK